MVGERAREVSFRSGSARNSPDDGAFVPASHVDAPLLTEALSLRGSAGGGSAVPVFLERVGDGLLERHLPALCKRLLPRLLSQVRAHRGDVGVGLGGEFGVPEETLSF